MPKIPVSRLAAVACVLLLPLVIVTLKAEASPRFSVANDTDAKINVYIFKGDDSFCTFEEKLKSVSAGETDSLGCTGDGKGQCKVQFYADGDEVCKTDRNTCNKNATKVAGGETVTVTQTGDSFSCSLS